MDPNTGLIVASPLMIVACRDYLTPFDDYGPQSVHHRGLFGLLELLLRS